MHNIYGRYKNARNASWQFLIDNNIKSLPVNLKSIAKKLDIKMLSYKDGFEILELLDMFDKTIGNDGFCLFLNDKWTIFYDDKICSKGRIRFTIAHELGHILLGHKTESKQNKFFRLLYTKTNNEQWANSPIETDANIFASSILAPATVLAKINAFDCITIMDACKISHTTAEIRSERMDILLKRSNFDNHPLEQAVSTQFKDFINDYNKNRHT